MLPHYALDQTVFDMCLDIPYLLQSMFCWLQTGPAAAKQGLIGLYGLKENESTVTIDSKRHIAIYKKFYDAPLRSELKGS